VTAGGPSGSSSLMPLLDMGTLKLFPALLDNFLVDVDLRSLPLEVPLKGPEPVASRVFECVNRLPPLEPDRELARFGSRCSPIVILIEYE
jgi:hypothetical protein